MKKDIFIPTEISKIIGALNQEFNIISISENGATSTIKTDTVTIFDNLSVTKELATGMIITINNKNYQVSNVVNLPNNKTFDITASGLTATKWNVAANFKTGNRFEINQMLEQDKTDLNRFPLIWLIPTDEQDFYHDNWIDFSANLTIVFAHKSNKTDRTLKRFENNIEPVIQPLMDLFNLWVLSSDFNYMFEFSGSGKPIEYTKTNFPFYGNSDKSKEVLNITTDAIEVSYTLQFKKQY